MFRREFGIWEQIRCHNDLPGNLSLTNAAFNGEDNVTFSAPLSIHCFAFVLLIPPPSCKAAGHADNASCAAVSFPGPSMITWAPLSALSL